MPMEFNKLCTEIVASMRATKVLSLPEDWTYALAEGAPLCRLTLKYKSEFKMNFYMSLDGVDFSAAKK